MQRFAITFHTQLFHWTKEKSCCCWLTSSNICDDVARPLPPIHLLTLLVRLLIKSAVQFIFTFTKRKRSQINGGHWWWRFGEGKKGGRTLVLLSREFKLRRRKHQREKVDKKNRQCTASLVWFGGGKVSRQQSVKLSLRLSSGVQDKLYQPVPVPASDQAENPPGPVIYSDREAREDTMRPKWLLRLQWYCTGSSKRWPAE